MDYSEVCRKSERKYDGVIINVRLDEVELHNGTSAKREVVEHPGAVVVIPVDAEGYAYCVRQFRYPFSEHFLEVPAGKLEPGEEPFTCAARELSEETGIKAKTFSSLGHVIPIPSYCEEKHHLFIAEGLSFGEAHPDEDEFLYVVKIHIDTLYDQCIRGGINDSKTIAAVVRAKHFLEEKKRG